MPPSLFFEVDPEAARASLADGLSDEPWYAGVALEPLPYARGDGKGSPGLTHVLVVRATDPGKVPLRDVPLSWPDPLHGYPVILRKAGAEGTPVQAACEPEEPRRGPRRRPGFHRRPYRGVEE